MPTTYYRDITWGYNGNYAATKGYDYITGLGSPMAGSLVPALERSVNKIGLAPERHGGSKLWNEGVKG